jgi:ribose transport system permease protein
VVGAFVAVMLLQVLKNLFNFSICWACGSFYQMTVTGVIIVLAILFDKLIDSRSGGPEA